jgi:single-stranded-DNA-specific exonuclease
MVSRLKKRWVIHEHIPADIDQALSGYPPFFRQVLYARGIHDPALALEYLEGHMADGAEDPFQLMDMKDVVKRLEWAITRRERITVYGDYDVDGVTATALLTQVLEALGAKVEAYIPDRFEEGYGLNIEALESLASRGVQVVVTVDCGIRSPAEAVRAEALGIDLIISDHHHPGSEIPDAYAVICPKREGDGYPYKELSGVGLAYKIAQALIPSFPGKEINADNWLDLVALGTVADMAPLTGENRLIVRRGLDQMRATGLKNRPGLLSLANVAGVKLEKISAGDIAFILAPRLNAAGRLYNSIDSLDLLMCSSREDAGRLAQQLDNHNRERQDLTRKMQEEAIRAMQGMENENIIFAFQESFNAGIVGLVAARLVDSYYRPAVVGHIDGDYIRASCRSIPEFHITRALDQCQDLLVRHGGHALAAGFTVHRDNLAPLMDRLSAIARDELSSIVLCASLRADQEIPLEKLQPAMIHTFLRYLDSLQPTGQSNPEAVFVSRSLDVVSARTVGGDKQHLRLTVRAGNVSYDGIAFRQGYRMDEMRGKVDLLYSVELNEFNGRTNLQLNVRDFKATGLPDD